LGLYSGQGAIVLERAGKNFVQIKGEMEGKIVKEFDEGHKVYTTLRVPSTYDAKMHDSEDAGNFL
jgi:hypothetical protein